MAPTIFFRIKTKFPPKMILSNAHGQNAPPPSRLFPIRKNSYLFAAVNGNNASANKCPPDNSFEIINLCFRLQTNSPAGSITNRTE